MVEVCQKLVWGTDMIARCLLTWRISHALAKAAHHVLRLFEKVPAVTSDIDQRCLAQDLLPS